MTMFGFLLPFEMLSFDLISDIIVFHAQLLAACTTETSESALQWYPSLCH